MADDDQEKTHIPPIKKSNQKLRVKLKIHKIKQQEQEEDEEQEGDLGIWEEIGPLKNDEPRVCNVCHKGFSSGKALGGHMRVHIQANKEQQQILSVNKKNNNDDTAHAGNRAICSLCGKTFPSMKSLFGHMRCHPEREWRGIQPPDQKQPPAAKKISPSEQIDLIECLRGWSSTAKRGRKALTPSPTTTDDPPEEEERLQEAVEYLMTLAQGDSFDSSASLTHENRVDDHEGRNGKLSEILEDENLVFQSKKRGIEESLGEYNVGFEYPVKKLKIEELSGSPVAVTPSKNLERGKGKAIAGGEIQDCKEFVEGDETESQKSDYSIPSGNLIVNYKSDGQIMKIKKKRKKVKLMDLGRTPGVDKPNPVYKCSTCDKCFTTHQALGGHRSSHNKIRSIHYVEHHENSDIHIPNHPPATGVDELKENGEGDGGSKVVAESTTHQCKICNKTFPTGQALGGHKRCHWTGQSGPLEAPSSQAGSPGEASHTGRKILGFDLNEVPPMEEEVESEHHAAGYGYASSSYNSQ
ncbi:hypothetical protein Vadar_029333 [Vaccinium darrowii]|uniref:Uncharacterized protein n=1 Tax=Vaccinium darrowii TaxID=229202 RepID=A0ACB7XVI9_9ERIC|nr:hypothetical protein Vadar_029333 [Vaccinium darrowii]